MTISPRCPYCNATGLKHLAIQEVGPITLVYCGQCGAIHGVLPRPPAQSSELAREARPAKNDEPAPPPKFDILAHLSQVELPPPRLYSPEQLAGMARYSSNPTSQRRIVVTSHQPTCQIHHTPMQKQTIPSGPNAGRQVWVCPQQPCQEWHMVD
jgi:hypothetical protein